VKPEGKDVARRSAYTVERAEHYEVVLLIRQHHYSKSCSKTGLCWKMLDTMGCIVGAAMFLPPMPATATFIERAAAQAGRTCQWRRVIGLHRLVVLPEQPQNVASMLISSALRDLKRSKRWDAVVTYADVGAGHTGQVYRACNAEYLGVTGTANHWMDDSGKFISDRIGSSQRTRTDAQMRALGYTLKVSPAKHRFVWWLNPKRIRSPNDTAS